MEYSINVLEQILGENPINLLFSTENMLANTDGALLTLLPGGGRGGRSTLSVFSRGGSLLPSISADVRAILMTASHSEGTGRSFAPR